MKKALALLILLVLVVASVSAQETVDVVYLTDGQVITGKIIEHEKYPENRIKIQTEDGTVYIVKMADVEKIVEQTAEGSAVTVAADTGDDFSMSSSYINVNLLGFLQWGPILEYGFSVAEDLYLAPHLRLDGLGALNWILFPDDTWIYTPALGLTVLSFMDISPYNPNRLYYGGGFEIEGAGEIPFEQVILNIYGNLGYRWRTVGQKRFMNVGAHLGASYDFWWEELMIFAMAELSFGWRLGD
jgi:opacity protein-like surface antigen